MASYKLIHFKSQKKLLKYYFQLLNFCLSKFVVVRNAKKRHLALSFIAYKNSLNWKESFTTDWPKYKQTYTNSGTFKIFFAKISKSC